MPFIGQESKWPEHSKTRYNTLLTECRVVVCSEGGYAAWKLHKRNEMMVDASDKLVAYYNGSGTGGTASCVKYANKVGKPIINLYK